MLDMCQQLRSRNIGYVLNLRKLVSGFYTGGGKLPMLRGQQWHVSVPVLPVCWKVCCCFALGPVNTWSLAC